MWVMFEFLIPGVKHAKEADLGAPSLPLLPLLKPPMGSSG